MNLLEKYKSNSNVSVKNKDGLNIIKYKSLDVDWNDEEVRMARGLVLDNDGNIVARPFNKFFNLNELTGRDIYHEEVQALSAPDDGGIEVTDKRDGSLVIAFNYNDKLQFASSGSLDSQHTELFKQAVENLWSEELLKKAEDLSKKYTLLFEYTSPDNRIVLDYDKEEIVLIGMRETLTGKELTMKETRKITDGYGFDYVETLDFKTLDEVLKYTETTKEIEGVVVLFTETMKRIKIKTSEYFENHRKLSTLSLDGGGLKEKQISLIEDMILSGLEGDLDDITSRYRGREHFKDVVEELDEVVKSILTFLKDIEDLADNSELLEQAKGKTYTEVINSDEKIGGIPIQTVFMVNVELNKFWKAQADYEIIRSAVKGTVHHRVLKKINEELGVVSNYGSKISPRSFIFKVLDKNVVWKKIGGLKVY